MSNPSPGGRPNTPRWKGSSGGGGGDSSRSWRGAEGGARAPHSAPQQKTARVILWGGLAGALIAALVLILLKLPHPTPVVVLAVSGYADALPPGAYVQEDAELLQGVLAPRGVFARDYRVEIVTKEEQADGALVAKLIDKINAAQSATVIVYLSAHGIVDEEGRPLLALAGFSPDQPVGQRACLDVSGLLHAVKEDVRAATNKILVVDACRAPFYWQVGFGPNRFENQFPGSFRQAVAKANCPNLHVVISSGSGQIGWAAPELGGSAFGHFLARGLAGEADRNQDAQIMLDELVPYLKAAVSSWVREHRLAAQFPEYWNATGEVAAAPSIKVADTSTEGAPLVQAAKDKQSVPFDAFVSSSAARGKDELQKSLDSLDDLWSRHANLAAISSDRHADLLRRFPEKWAHLEHLLIRAEQYAFAGTAYQLNLRTKVGDTQRILDELESSTEDVPPLSLPLAAEAGDAAAAADATTLDELGKREQIAIAELKQLVTKLKSSGAAGEPEPVECMFARMLAAHLPEGSGQETIVPAAIQTRLLAERIAAPADVRALNWSKNLLDDDTIEVPRRDLEDRLFVGGDAAAMRALAEEYVQLRGRLDANAAAIKTLQQGFRDRDAGLAALPHLVQWHLANLQVAALPSDPSADAAEQAEIHRQELRRLMEGRSAAQSLSAWLTNPTSNAADATRELTAAIDATRPVIESMKTLQEQFRQWTTTEADDEEQARQIWLALQTPLLTGELRATLRDRLLRRLSAHRLPPFGSVSSQASDSSPRAAGDDGSGQGGESPAELLAGFHDAADPALAEASDDAWKALEKNAYRDRYVASFQSFRAVSDEATEKLHGANRLRQWVWHADRAADDFWGPAEDPYFRGAALEFTSRARELARDLRIGSSDSAIQSVESLLTSRTAASSQGIRFAASSILLAQESNPLDIQFPAEGLPKGEAVVSVRDPAGEFRLSLQPDHSRFGLDTAQLYRECRLEFSGDLGAQVENCADLSVLFRGHVWDSGRLCLPTGKFHAVAWTRPDYGPPRVTVQGREQQIPHLMFILDCSYSMTDPLNVAELRSRMETAKSTLRRVVESLERDQYNIGLTLFAHQYGSREGQDKQVHPEARDGRQASWLQVLTDVETKFSQERLGDPATLDSLERALRDAEPYGITPLYHSILTTLQRSAIGDDQFMQIVVLTDGEDTQGEYANRVPGFKVTRKDDVAAEIRKLGDRLIMDVIGLAFDGGTTGVAELARQTGGEFHFVSNTNQLEQSLANLLRSVQYSVRPASAAAASAPQVDLDATYPVDLANPAGPHQFVVAMHGVKVPIESRVVLEGGEHLLLQYRRQSDAAASLFHSRYLGTSAVASYPTEQNASNPLASDVAFSPRECYVTAHNPEVDGKRGVVFRVSIQNQDERSFSLRPRHVWAEIRPILRDQPQEAWPVYPFFDMAFEQNKPVPVLMFHIPSWPWGETDAEIRLWFTYKEDLREERIPLPIQEADSYKQELPPVAGLEGVAFIAEVTKENNAGRPFGIVIREEHTSRERSSPGDLYAARVQIWPTPSTATHKYYDESNLVRHEFIFADTAALRTETPEVRITPSAEITSPVVSVAIDGRTVGLRKVGPLVVRVPAPR